MSVNRVNKTTGDLSLLAGANNITNTTGVAELSALSNIGTSANATQHEVNVAVDSAIKWETLSTSGVSFSQNDVTITRLTAKKNKMFFVLEGEIGNATLTIDSATTLKVILPNNYPVSGMYTTGTLQFWEGTSKESSGYAYYTGGHDIFLFSNSDNNPTSGATLRFSIIVPLL